MKNGIIAFCGSKGAGKSTSATIFMEMYHGAVEELAFAGYLKETCSKVFKVDMKFFLDPSLKEVELENYVTLNSVNIKEVLKLFKLKEVKYDQHVRPHIGQVFDTPRRLLQYIGTEVLHPFDPLIHAKMTLSNKNKNKLSIITDLRFKNEFDYCKDDPNFLPVYVKNLKAEYGASSDSHPSEKQLQLFKHLCIELDNNSDVSVLRRNIKEIVDTYYSENT